MDIEYQKIYYNESEDYRIRYYIIWLILILPALISQFKGFGGTYEYNALIAEEGSLSGKLLYFILFAVCLFFLWRYKYKIFWSVRVYFFIAFLLTGIFYSNYPNMVLRGVFVAITSLMLWSIFAQILIFNFDIKKLLNSIPTFFLFWGLLEFFFWSLSPRDYFDYGYMANYVGYFFQPNLLAKLLCIGIIFKFFFMLYDKKSRSNFIQIFILLAILYSTGSRTSLVSLIIAVSLVQIIASNLSIMSKLKFVISLFISGIIFYFLFNNFFIKQNVEGLLYGSTLSYRIEVWSELLPLMFHNFWFGAGINSFWNADLFYKLNFYISGVHNGYLQVFQDIGFIGFVLLFGILFQILKSIKEEIFEKYFIIFRYSLITSWVYFFIVNFTEGDLGNYRSSLWGVLMTISILWFYLIKENKMISIQ